MMEIPDSLLRKDFTLYELWSEEDLREISLPKRSPLRHLAPIGMGTPYVESLTSYISRLAAAHTVSTLTLVQKAVLPLYLNREPESSKGSINATPSKKNTFDWGRSPTLNGTTTLTAHWVHSLESLTWRNDLQYTTMLIWKEVISQVHLIRRKRAWCPDCLNEWQKNGQILYEPLIWALEVVKICPKHHQYLHTRCPNNNCRQRNSLPLLSSMARPGYCPDCYEFLGVKPAQNANNISSLALDHETSRWQEWIVCTIGELLVAAGALPFSQTQTMFSSNIRSCLAHLTGGKVYALCYEWCVASFAMHGWISGTTLPSLITLLQLSYYLNKSIFSLFTQPIEFTVKLPSSERKAIKNKKDHSTLAELKANAEYIRQALVAHLSSEDKPLLTMRQVAQELGYSWYQLHSVFPELCRAISAHYAEDYHKLVIVKRQKIKDGYLEAKNLTKKMLLHKPHKPRQVFNKEVIKAELELILSDKTEPPPTMKEVAARLNYDPSYLCERFPDLCHAISGRFLIYRREQRLKRKTQAIKEVGEITINLHTQNIYPSYARVITYMSNPHLMRDPEVRRLWSETLKSLGYPIQHK